MDHEQRADNHTDLGEAANRWKDIFLSGEIGNGTGTDRTIELEDIQVSRFNFNSNSRRIDALNFKTFTNNVAQNVFRFSVAENIANNGFVGNFAGTIKVNSINDRSNTVHASTFTEVPIILRKRSTDTMVGTVGSALYTINAVIGSAVTVSFANASALTIDLQVTVNNVDAGGGEQLVAVQCEGFTVSNRSGYTPTIADL